MSMNVYVFPFEPTAGSTVSISPTASSAVKTLLNNIKTPQPQGRDRAIRVFNSGTLTAFVEFGTATSVVATTSNSMPVPAGAVEVFSGVSVSHIACLATGTGSGAVYFTAGEGT
jgi:hypothetical protein